MFSDGIHHFMKKQQMTGFVDSFCVLIITGSGQL